MEYVVDDVKKLRKRLEKHCTGKKAEDLLELLPPEQKEKLQEILRVKKPEEKPEEVVGMLHEILPLAWDHPVHDSSTKGKRPNPNFQFHDSDPEGNPDLNSEEWIYMDVLEKVLDALFNGLQKLYENE